MALGKLERQNIICGFESERTIFNNQVIGPRYPGQCGSLNIWDAKKNGTANDSTEK